MADSAQPAQERVGGLAQRYPYSRVHGDDVVRAGDALIWRR